MNAQNTIKLSVAQLQADTNIVWIGEIYSDYTDLDGTYEGQAADRHKYQILPNGDKIYHDKQTTTIIKLQQQNYNISNSWQTWFWDRISQANTPAFADAELSRALTPTEKQSKLFIRDTLNLPTDNFFPTFTVIINPIPASDIVSYRMRQILYFDKKIGHYQIYPVAIAPLYIKRDDNGNYAALQPLFWLPVITTPAPVEIADPAIPYIKKVAMSMYFSQMKVLKNTKTAEQCTTQMLQNISIDINRIPKTGVNVRAVTALRFSHIFAWHNENAQLIINSHALELIYLYSKYSENAILYFPLNK
jgi:hypothetical protein